MPIEKFEIQPLFAIPYAKADLGYALTSDQIEYVKKLKMVKNRDNLISENLYIFGEPELKVLAEAVQEALDRYARDVMGITQKLQVTQSWGLMNPHNVGMHSHSHSNSLVSGSLYYCELPDPVSRVFFDRNTMYRQIELNPEDDKRNLYNSPVNMITPKTNELYMFPSDINHMIEANVSTEPRRAIAFNSFVKGRFGSYRDVSELTI
jgi:uncharacterized protein (TIGR02466 family)